MLNLPQSIGLVRGVAIAVSMVIRYGILGLPSLVLEKRKKLSCQSYHKVLD